MRSSAVLSPADTVDRGLAASLVGVAAPWLLYTRLYFFLQPRHLTFDGGLFMWAFNKPDPSCGLTRTFAWLWVGDLWRAVSVYPLGPLVFAVTVVFLVYGLLVLVTGRALHLHLSTRFVRLGLAISLTALGLNWIAKLLWLGM